MPITIKPEVMKYRDPTTGDYKGVDVIAERTTSEQVADIVAEGSEQIQAIQDQADAAMSALPSAETLTDLSSDFAPQYSNIVTYAVGDYCMHDYKLYRCKTAIATPESWTASHWTLINATGEITNVKNTLTETQIQTDPTARLIITPGKYWTGDVNETISQGTLNTYNKYDLLTCRTGDKFFLHVHGSSSASPYYILDQNKKILSKASESSINTTITVSDDNAYYLAVNNNTSVVAEPKISLVTETQAEIATLTSDVTTLANNITYLTDFINVADMIKRVRAGGKTFSFSGMTTGYFTVIFDDGRHDLSTVQSIFAEYQIPFCAAIPTSALNNVCDNTKTVLEVCEDIVAAGGEILSHGVNSHPLTSPTDYTWLKTELMVSKQILTQNGFNIRGFIKPGGDGAIDWSGNNLQRFTQLFYDYANACGDDAEYKKGRIGLGYDSIETLKGYVDDAATNHKWYTTMSHTLDGTEENLNETYLRTFIEYALSQNIEFKTYAYMYDTFGTWS